MKRARLTGLLAKIEAVEGTDVVPAAATDGIQLEEHLWSNLETDYLERNLRENAAGNRMGRQGGAQPAGPWGRITAVVALKGAGMAYAAGERPELDVLLRICGHSATVDATPGTESITYEPIDENHESASIYAFSAGTRYKLLGCRGRISSITLIPAQIGIARFEIWGTLASVPDDLALPAIDYPRRAVKPPVVKAEDLTLDGFAARYRTLTWEQGAEVVARPRGGAPEGHAGYGITDYDPQFTAQIDSPTKAVFNPWQLERDGQEFAWSVAIGSTQFNRASLAGGNGQIIRLPQAEDQGYAMIDTRVRCLHGDDDPAYTITFD